MSEHPSIKAEDVREGDMVEVTYKGTVVALDGNSPVVNSEPCRYRLISRPTPPEPPLRVGDWVRALFGDSWQLTTDGQLNFTLVWPVTRIEPPVGWPVGVSNEDGVRWFTRELDIVDYYSVDGHRLTWPELLAAGGIPARPPGGAE